MQRKPHTPAVQVTLDARVLVDTMREERGFLLGGLQLREVEAVLWTRKAIDDNVDAHEIAAQSRRLCRALRNNRGRKLRGLSADEIAAVVQLEKSLEAFNQDAEHGA